MVDYYSQIFKRKSFHLFRDIGTITGQELAEIKQFIFTVTPLDNTIKFAIKIVPELETTSKRGAQYCILFYSETTGNYLQNIGYIGEQIDLYLVSKNIGTLWYGIGKPKEMQIGGLEFVIMMAVSKMPENKFRKDMFKAKRKPLEKFWLGETLGVAEIVRFSPSACNTQPWIVENTGEELLVYRYKKPNKRGIMPANKVTYYNRIDIGIFLYFLEICLQHEGYFFQRAMSKDETDVEKSLAASYSLRTENKQV